MEFKTYSVSPWGEVAADTGTTTRLRLAGQQYDQATRLYFMRARYYDPALGRFLSEDPIGISGGLNLYAYAGDDPVNAEDPSGTQACVLTYYRVPVVGGTDTLWDRAVPARWECWSGGDFSGGAPAPIGAGSNKGPWASPGTSGVSDGTTASPPTSHRKCYADLAKLAIHVVIDATALNELKVGIDLMHDAGVARNIAGILHSPDIAATANRMMGAGVAKVAERFGVFEMVSGAARDLDVDYLIDRAAGVTSSAPSLGRTLWGLLPGASSVIALGDALRECP